MKTGLRLQCLFVITAALAVPAPQACAQAEKPLATKSGFVTSADGAKIHYIEAGQTRMDVGEADHSLCQDASRGCDGPPRAGRIFADHGRSVPRCASARHQGCSRPTQNLRPSFW